MTQSDPSNTEPEIGGHASLRLIVRLDLDILAAERGAEVCVVTR